MPANPIAPNPTSAAPPIPLTGINFPTPNLGTADTAYNAQVAYDQYVNALGGGNASGTGIDTSAQPATSGDGGISGFLSSLGGALSSPLGELAMFGGAGALLGSQASSEAAENNNLAAQIEQIGQPALGESNTLLSDFSSGTLAPPFQSQLNTLLTQINQQATTQKGQVASALATSGGGQNISGALTSQTQQIDAATQLATQNAVSNAFIGELTASTNLLGAGGGFVEKGILSTIQNNNQLQQTMASIFGSLASAYAQSQGGGGGGGTTGGGGTGVGGLGGLAKNIGNAINQLIQPNTTALTNSIQGNVNSTLASDLGPGGSLALPDIGQQTFFNQATTDQLAQGGSVIAPQVGDTLSSDTGDVLGDIGYGFNSAGGGAAAAGAGAGDLGLGATQLAGGNISAIGADAASNLAVNPADINAINAAGGATNALGEVLPGIGAAAGAYGTVNAIEQGNTLGGALSGAETGASIGSFIGPEGTLIGGAIGGLVGLGGALIKGKHTQENVARVGPGQNVIKLQSGNSALAQGGVAFGAGSSRGGGSAQWFLVPQATGTIERTTGKNAGAIGGAESGQPNVSKGTPFYIGSQASSILTNFANSVPLKGGQPDFSSYLSQYQKNPDANTGLIGVFNNNGGQQGWGQTFPQWLQAIWSVKRNVTGNLST